MYKALALLILVIAGSTYGQSSINTHSKQYQRLTSSLNHGNVGLDLCPECINEAVELINVVLNVILDEGILGTCGEICQAVYNYTNSTELRDACDIGCDAVGVDEFIKIIINADIDPIYYCQLVKMCPINDNGDAKFTNFCVYPKSGPEGTTFVIDLTFRTVNGTGTGTFTFNVIDPKNETSGDLYWFEEKKPGVYPERIQFQTITIPTCDPTKGACSGFPLGTYNVTGQICNGDCGSHHPHTSVYDNGFASFEVTKKTD